MRRFALSLMLVATLVASVPGTAVAWCNGPPVNGHKGNGYGTHDWLLDRAIKQAGADGTWVIRKTALLATDNPDTTNKPAMYQAYRPTGTLRGAPHMVSELYHKIVVAYGVGDMATASTLLGELSHYYSDITQPFHTTSASAPYRPLHKQYEFLVDDHENTPTRSLSWITLRPVLPVTDVSAKTAAAADYARDFYPALFKAFKASRTVAKGTTNRITRLVQSRAVNDLADIIASVPTASGEAPAVGNVSLSLVDDTPRYGRWIDSTVTVTGEDGAPLNAVRVVFTWALPGGTVTVTSFTDKDGRLRRVQMLGDTPVGRTLPLTVRVLARGVTTTSVAMFTVVR